MMRYLLWGLGGLAWMFLSFFVGFYITFPSDAVRERIEYESVGATDKQFALSMSSVRPWFTGARATDVTVYGLKRGRRTKDNPEPGYDRSPILTADSLVIEARPMAWAMGKRAIGWDASLLGGSIEGDYAESEAAVDVGLDVSDIDLSQLGLSNADRTILLTGVLVGAADLHFDTEDTKQSSGTFSLEAEGFGLAKGSTIAGFGLPEASFSKAVIKAEIDNGKIVLQEGTFEGSVMSATLSGDITINKKILRSRHKLDFAFTLPEEFDQLAQLMPSLKRSKDEEGRYHCAVNGQLFAPTFRCGKATTSRRTADPADREGGITGAGGLAGGSFDPDMTDEERRAAREERIKERRERLKKRREEAAKARGDAPAPAEPRRPGDLVDPMDDELPDMGPPGMNDNFPMEEPDLQGPPDVDLAPPDDNWVPGDDQTR